MLTNDAFRAMLNSQPAQADATPAEPEEPEQPQRTAADLWAEAPTQPPVPFDGSHGFGLLGSCGCFDIAAEHVDPDCDLCAQNPHADLWAESDELSERKVAQGLGIIRQSKTDSRRLRGDLVPLSLVKRVLDSTGRWDGVPERAAERAVALAKSARIAPNTWQLGRAQARRVPIHTGLQTLLRGAAASTSRRSCPLERACTLLHPPAPLRYGPLATAPWATAVPHRNPTPHPHHHPHPKSNPRPDTQAQAQPQPQASHPTPGAGGRGAARPAHRAEPAGGEPRSQRQAAAGAAARCGAAAQRGEALRQLRTAPRLLLLLAAHCWRRRRGLAWWS